MLAGYLIFTVLIALLVKIIEEEKTKFSYFPPILLIIWGVVTVSFIVLIVLSAIGIVW